MFIEARSESAEAPERNICTGKTRIAVSPELKTSFMTISYKHLAALRPGQDWG
jgi:hypothetical protein